MIVLFIYSNRLDAIKLDILQNIPNIVKRIEHCVISRLYSSLRKSCRDVLLKCALKTHKYLETSSQINDESIFDIKVLKDTSFSVWYFSNLLFFLHIM